MSVITTSSFIKDLWPGIKNHFGVNYNDFDAEYRLMFDVVSSDKRYEERVQRVGYGLAAQKAEGSSLLYDTANEGYTSRLTNVAYALGSKITREAIADNQYIELGQSQTRWMARSMMQTKENVSANVYNRGFNSSYVGGDGKELFATDHPSQSGNQSNELATPADLSEASLEDLAIQIMQAKDDRGLRINLRPRRLITATDEYFNAQRILKSELQSNTANNDINVLRAAGVIPEIVTGHYLTDADAFFIMTDIPEEEGMIFQQREEVSLEMDNEFDTKDLCYSAYERYAAGWADWRGAYGSSGA